MTEFTCKKCDKDFTAEWDFGDAVTCPHCDTQWETDYEESWDGIQGPWLTIEKKSSLSEEASEAVIEQRGCKY